MAVSRMKIEKITTIEQDCYFSGLTLLSIEEYNENKDHIKPINNWWWLRSSYEGDSIVSSVDYVGDISYGTVYDSNCSVRPALILESANLHVGDRFKFYEHNWTVISERYALCDEEFCRMAFREYWGANNANIYDASDIKTYLDDEWDKMKGGEQDDRTKTN